MSDPTDNRFYRESPRGEGRQEAEEVDRQEQLDQGLAHPSPLEVRLTALNLALRLAKRSHVKLTLPEVLQAASRIERHLQGAQASVSLAAALQRLEGLLARLDGWQALERPALEQVVGSVEQSLLQLRDELREGS